ncbi:MAG: hypothetical protein ABW185_23590 [Sedimenticola sp.]
MVTDDILDSGFRFSMNITLQLQQEICASEIDSSGIQRIQDLAQTYVQQAGDNEPQLLNKVKTHLLMHLVIKYMYNFPFDNTFMK